MKRANIHLSYWKQGDDFASNLEENPNSIVGAFSSMRKQMESVAEHLGRVAEFLSSVPVEEIEVGGDVHWIWITGPDEIIDQMVDAELAHHDPLFDDEEEEGEEYCGFEDEEECVLIDGLEDAPIISDDQEPIEIDDDKE